MSHLNYEGSPPSYLAISHGNNTKLAFTILSGHLLVDLKETQLLKQKRKCTDLLKSQEEISF